MREPKLPNDGERMIPGYHQGRLFYGEHIIRYRSAQDLVKGLDVLDIASGEGYGSNMLAETAKYVYGVDNNQVAITHAQKKYRSTNLKYILGNATKIPLADHIVDAVVSFETIEHVKQYKQFLSEVKRVLRPNGIFILSTPNSNEYPETNPYHVHEFSFNELNKLLNRQFSYVSNFYQATWLYSALLDKKSLGTRWERKINTLQVTPLSTDNSVYFFSVCSNQALKVKPNLLGALSEYSNIREMDNQRLSIQTMSAKIKSQKQEIEQMNGEMDRLGILEKQLQQIKTSLAWRLRNKLVKLLGREPI